MCSDNRDTANHSPGTASVVLEGSKGGIVRTSKESVSDTAEILSVGEGLLWAAEAVARSVGKRALESLGMVSVGLLQRHTSVVRLT